MIISQPNLKIYDSDHSAQWDHTGETARDFAIQLTSRCCYSTEREDVYSKCFFFYRTSFQSSSNFISAAAAAADNKTATGGAATLQRLSKLGSANGR